MSSKLQVGDLVKYKSACAGACCTRPLADVAIGGAYYKFDWTWQQCVDNLIGLVTKIENNKIFIHWFCLNKIIWEYKNYLKVVR